MDVETGDLTATVFEEANRVVQSAYAKEYEAIKRAKEAQGQVRVLWMFV